MNIHVQVDDLAFCISLDVDDEVQRVEITSVSSLLYPLSSLTSWVTLSKC